MTQTKVQQRREAAYRKQLKRCGFRSWTRANERRGELIDRDVYDKSLTSSERVELDRLQRLTELYVRWKTNDALGRSTRAAKRLLKSLEKKREEQS